MAWSGFILILSTLLLIAAPVAKAGSVYYEFGGGAATVTNTGYFGNRFSGASDLGASANASLFYSFQGSAPLAFQLGLSDRFVSFSANSTSYMYNGLYPALRIQLSILYFGGGATIFGATDKGDGNFALDTSLFAYYGEAGGLWAVTPLFSLGGYGAIQMPSSAANSAATLEFGAILRFYIWVGSGGSKSSGEFHGWRYPFGQEIH